MNINTYFTKETDVRAVILDLLDGAASHVVVAVAWFTDSTLFGKLLELQRRGVNVELIITSHDFNRQSANAYEEIEMNGGFFAEIGSDDQLMHMKFCVIDYATVISGSANWSNRAFSVNNEEVTVVIGHHQRASDFLNEFDRLKLVSGKVRNHRKALDVDRALKIFDLIKAFISLGDTGQIQPYVHQLKHVEGLEDIHRCLAEGRYDEAVKAMDDFRRSYTQVIDVSFIERELLKNQIKLLSFKIENLEIEKTEIETLVEQFHHRYVLELNPLISRILKLKRKIFEKLEKHGIKDSTYKDLEEEFRRTNEELDREKEIDIPDLSDEEMRSIKEMHREAVKYCHPDAPSCIYEDKAKAAQVFTELTNAVKRNDLEKVKFIWSELRSGRPIEDMEMYDELSFLKARLEALRVKYDYLLHEIAILQRSEMYKRIQSIGEDWNAYFENKKLELDTEYQRLENQFCQS